MSATTRLDRLAAIDHHGVADDKRCRIRTQPDHSCGDFLGLAHPADRFLRNDPLLTLGVPPVNRSIIGVAIMPGQTEFTRMFCAA